MAKINITLADELLHRIDAYADENYMTRSGFMSFACNQYLNSADLNRLVKDMSLAMRKIADSGTIDDESQAILKDFERLSAMLWSK